MSTNIKLLQPRTYIKNYNTPFLKQMLSRNAETFAQTFADPSMTNRGLCTCACYVTESQMAAGHNGNNDWKWKTPVKFHWLHQVSHQSSGSVLLQRVSLQECERKQIRSSNRSCLILFNTTLLKKWSGGDWQDCNRTMKRKVEEWILLQTVRDDERELTVGITMGVQQCVHTKPAKFKNASLFLCFGPPSTQRWCFF